MNFEPVFCTVFDKNYLYQGVTLYHSLAAILPQFKLYCLVLDDQSVDTLRKLHFRNLIVVPLSELPPEQVGAIRMVTHYGQFCWAMQPLICRWVLDQGEPSATYIEADAYFFSSPEPIFKELENYSASVAPHWYSQRNAELEKLAGRYCTHFNFFRNDTAGREILEHWRTQCFQYHKDQPRFYPGQLGLNEWTKKFPRAHELVNRGAGVAPWNVDQYEVSASTEGTPLINAQKIIFYHYHQLVRYQDGNFELGVYPLSDKVLEIIYKPYVRALLKAENDVNNVVPNFKFKREIPLPPAVLPALLSGNLDQIKKATQPIRRKLKGIYNVFTPDFFGWPHV